MTAEIDAIVSRIREELADCERQSLEAIVTESATLADGLYRYYRSVVAKELLDSRFGAEIRDEREAKELEKREREKRQRREERLNELAGLAVPFRREWIDRGDFAALPHAGKIVLPVVVSLIDPAANQTFLSPAQIAELAGVSYRTAQEGTKAITDAGLVKRGTWRPNGGAIRKTWYSLPREAPDAR